MFLSLLHLKPQSKAYVNEQGGIRYLDAGNINRPLTMPKTQVIIMAVFVAVGVLIGAWMLFHVNDAVFGSAERKQQEIDANLTRDVAYDLPVLSTLVSFDDDTIRQNFADAGYSLYEYSDPADYPNGGFAEAHFPSDLDNTEATELFDQGISSLDAEEASQLLKGLWMFSVDRSEYLDMRVRYADFSSDSLDAAITAAMEQQGFSAESILAEDGEGVDDVGNTYKAGTIEIDGVTYQWRISAVLLSEVYSISGLPDNALYVGIRITE